MWLLHRAILMEILANTLLGVSLFTLVLVLQRLGKLFEILVRGSATVVEGLLLVAWATPAVLTFSVPIGVLVGVLMTFSRLAVDGELTAVQAAGISLRRLLLPAILLSGGALVGCLWVTTVLTPRAIVESHTLASRLLARQVTAQIQPRVFQEGFPDFVIYVGDVVSGPVVHWRQVFLADLRPAAKRVSHYEASDLPRITVAREALAIRDVERGQVQLSLIDGRTYEVGSDPEKYYASAFPRGEQVLATSTPRPPEARPFSWMSMGALRKEMPRSIEAGIEFHRRLALPVACLFLALVGVPLGSRIRRAGRSYAFALTILIAFGYYTSLVSLIGMARQRRIPVELAVWAPDALLGLLSWWLLRDLDRAKGWEFVSLELPLDRLGQVLRRFRALRFSTTARLPLLPQLIDRYVLAEFSFYFVVLLVSFVALIHVFTFFELLGDIIKNQVPLKRVLTYHLFLTPKLIYDVAPLSVLTAILISFGVLARHNELTAFKACGVSAHRLAAPVLIAGFLLSATLFALDYRWLPQTNRVQDAIRNEIKGRPVQTYLRPDRKWIFGQGPRIYYYRYFDPAERLMVGVSVYELEPSTFRLRRQIWAERARWEETIGRWVFQDGWVRELRGIEVVRYESFRGSARTFAELSEPPSYFLKEVKQEQQMNFRELAAYIQELQQSGFDTVRLRVQFHEKFVTPLFSWILALVATPFAFMLEQKSSVVGAGVTLLVALGYWVTSGLFEQIGYLNQLPAPLAAWAPALLFTLAGAYLFTRVRT